MRTTLFASGIKTHFNKSKKTIKLQPAQIQYKRRVLKYCESGTLPPGSINNVLTMIDPSLRLRRAIHASDALLCGRILKSHPSLLHNPDFSPTGLSNTSLHLACFLGHLPIVSLLLRLGHEGSSVSLNEDHQTPLMLAARHGHTDVIHLLCTSGCAAVERQDNHGRDAVMFASLGGYDTCIQILLTYAPELPQASTYFPAIPPSAAPATPISISTSISTSTSTSTPVSALASGSSSIASASSFTSLGGTAAQRALLQHADIDGNTALHFASSNGHLLALRTLLAAGADAEKRNIWSWTAVNYSATVAAEVYFKNLIADTARRRGVQMEVERRGVGGGVRLVGKEAGDGVREEGGPASVIDGGWAMKGRGDTPPGAAVWDSVGWGLGL